MKTLLEFLDNSILNNLLITESFKSSIIRDIRQQFNDRIKKNHEKNALNKYSNDDTSSTFKKVFGNETIAWQLEKTPTILFISEVFHLDKSGKDSNPVQPLNI